MFHRISSTDWRSSSHHQFSGNCKECSSYITKTCMILHRRNASRGQKEWLSDNKRTFTFYSNSDSSWFLMANSTLLVLATSLKDMIWILMQALVSPTRSSEGSLRDLREMVLASENHPTENTVFALKQISKNGSLAFFSCLYS